MSNTIGLKWKKFIKQDVFLLYSIFFFFTGLITFSPFILSRHSFIANADGFNQYYPVFVYVGRYLRTVLHAVLHRQSIPLYDFNIGYGNDILATQNYMGLGDPFDFISGFVPYKWSSVAYTLVTVLRIYTAGTAFLVWGLSKKTRDSEHNNVLAACAIFYCYSGYTLANGLVLPTFLQPLIIMPLLIKGEDHLLEDKGSRPGHCLSILFIFAVFLQAICGFYFLYMETIAIAVYGIVILICRKKTFRYSVRAIINIILHYILGIGMSACIFIPVLIGYFHSSRSAESEVTITKYLGFYPVGGWKQWLLGLYRGPGFEYGLGLGAVCIFCLLVIWRSRARKEQKVLTAIVTIAYFLPIVGSIMNGFSYSASRWVFLLYFVYAASMVEVIPQISHVSVMIIVLYLLINVLWVITTLVDPDFQPGDAVWIICVILSAACVLITIHEERHTFLFRHKTVALSMLLVLCTAGMGFFNNAPHAVGGQGFYTAFKWFGLNREIDYSNFASYSEKTTGDNGRFFRTDLYDTSLNASLITGTAGTSSYTSIGNPGPYEFLSANMVTGGVHGFSFVLQGLEGRKALEMLLSVRYYTDDVNTEHIYNNPYYIPLGFTYDSYILSSNKDIQDPLDRNSILPHAVILDQEPEGFADGEETNDLSRLKGWDRKWEELPFRTSTEGLSGYGSADAFSVNNDGENGTVKVFFEKETDTGRYEYYLYFHDFHYTGSSDWVDVMADGKKVRLRPAGSYAGQKYDFMVKLKPETAESGETEIIMPAGAEYTLDSISLRRMDTSSYSEAYENRKSITLADTEIGTNEVSGTISIPKGQIRLLFMSIPFDKGWSCSIDGNTTEILRADDGFSAVLVPEGDHKITFQYMTPGLHIGIFVAFLSWIIFFALIIMSRKFDKREKTSAVSVAV